MKGCAQTKEFIKGVFVLKWRPLETSGLPRLKKCRKNGGVLQYCSVMGTMLEDRLKRPDFKGYFVSLKCNVALSLRTALN